jgi:metal-responsive CopG/Arc/MetJ family transcriptional regulator
MSDPIGVRLPKDILKKIEKMSKNEMEDRSTIIRKLVMRGYKDFMKQKAAEDYIRGSITFSEAAYQSGLSLWEMERHLVERGFKSDYSLEDLEKEMKMLKI